MMKDEEENEKKGPLTPSLNFRGMQQSTRHNHKSDRDHRVQLLASSLLEDDGLIVLYTQENHPRM